MKDLISVCDTKRPLYSRVFHLRPKNSSHKHNTAKNKLSRPHSLSSTITITSTFQAQRTQAVKQASKQASTTHPPTHTQHDGARIQERDGIGVPVGRIGFCFRDALACSTSVSPGTSVIIDFCAATIRKVREKRGRERDR